MFLRFAVWFCVNTLLIAVGVMLLLVASSYLGVTLPANYAELQLTEHTPEIQAAGTSPDQWIPDGADYGIYSPSGEWKTGTFGRENRRLPGLRTRKKISMSLRETITGLSDRTAGISASSDMTCI